MEGFAFLIDDTSYIQIYNNGQSTTLMQHTVLNLKLAYQQGTNRVKSFYGFTTISKIDKYPH